jgi:hypothetical protein
MLIITKNHLLIEVVFCYSSLHGRGGRNRTHARGFGDRCTATIRRPHQEATNLYLFLGLFVFSVLLAPFAEFGNDDAVLVKLFVLAGVIV